MSFLAHFYCKPEVSLSSEGRHSTSLEKSTPAQPLSGSRYRLAGRSCSRIGSAAMLVLVALSTMGASISAVGLTPFEQQIGGADQVFSAISQEGVDETVLAAISAADGSVLYQVGSYNDSINGLALHDDSGLLLAVIDEQFVTSVPKNNTPELVSIDADGEITNLATLAAPDADGFGGTMMSYLGASEGNNYYTMGFKYTVNSFTLASRLFSGTLRGDEVQYVLGVVDVSAASPSVDWSVELDFGTGTDCATHAQAYFTEILAGSVPNSFIHDLAFVDGSLRSVMTGSPDTNDVLIDIDPSTGNITQCVEITGDQGTGKAGGVAVVESGKLIYVDLSNGDIFSLSGTVASKVATGAGAALRGDYASNRTGLVEPVDPVVTTTTEPATTTTVSPTTVSPTTVSPTTSGPVTSLTTLATSTSPSTAQTSSTTAPIAPTSATSATAPKNSSPTTAPEAETAQLAFTGSSFTGATIAALMLIATGAILLVRARRYIGPTSSQD